MLWRNSRSTSGQTHEKPTVNLLIDQSIDRIIDRSTGDRWQRTLRGKGISLSSETIPFSYWNFFFKRVISVLILPETITLHCQVKPKPHRNLHYMDYKKKTMSAFQLSSANGWYRFLFLSFKNNPIVILLQPNKCTSWSSCYQPIAVLSMKMHNVPLAGWFNRFFRVFMRSVTAEAAQEWLLFRTIVLYGLLTGDSTFDWFINLLFTVK